jgi:hypothetical protein
MNQALKNLSAEQESINKIFLSEGGKTRLYKIATWVMVKYRDLTKNMCALTWVFSTFKIVTQADFRENIF